MPFTPKNEKRIADVIQDVEHQEKNPRSRRRRPGGRDSGLRRFELTENLAFGSNATAYLLKWTGAAYEAQSDVSFEVYDIFSKFNQKDKPTGQDGARGYAQWVWDRRIWEIITLEHQARWIEFYLSAALATTDASKGCDNVTYHDGYQPNTAVTTIYNKSASTDNIFSGADNNRGEALYDPVNDKYIITQIECP